VAALRNLQVHYQLFLVTNQSGVATRELTLQQVNEVNDFVVAWLQLHGVTMTAVYCCPHQRSDGCSCIKPSPYFLHQAARDYDVDLRRSFVVGDHPHDVELARNAGARGIYVLTGHGQKHRAKLDGGGVVVPGIAAAADWILDRTDVASAADRRSHPQDPASAVRFPAR
jgi:histidinol-phosphate phosphatase family protein